MPELPEVETVRRIAVPLVRGRTIERVKVSETFPCVLEGTAGIDPAPTLTGSVIVDVRRRGKYLLFELQSGLWIVIHLRMTGRLLVMKRDEPAVRFEHLAIQLDNGTDLRFGDQRKFGRVSVVRPEDVEALSLRLGIEPLSETFSGEWLHALLVRRTGKIKSVLLDQHLIAGLGNIYVDEALFRAGIHPFSTAKDLRKEDLDRLAEAIVHVLRTAIENQGTTFSTFENPYGESGSNAAFLKVYGRGKRHEPCLTCGTPLERGVVSGRGTTWCTVCQPAPEGAIPR